MIKHKSAKKHPGWCCTIHNHLHQGYITTRFGLAQAKSDKPNNYFCLFGLLWGPGERGAGDGSFFALVLPPYFPAGSGSGSTFVLNGDVGLWDRGDPTLGLLTGEFLWAEGQSCWLRHTEHRGLTGRQTCCPKPTSSQFISLHSSLEHREIPLKSTLSCVLGHLEQHWNNVANERKDTGDNAGVKGNCCTVSHLVIYFYLSKVSNM